MNAFVFIALLLVAVFAGDSIVRWRRQNAWKHRRDDDDDDHMAVV